MWCHMIFTFETCSWQVFHLCLFETGQVGGWRPRRGHGVGEVISWESTCLDVYGTKTKIE